MTNTESLNVFIRLLNELHGKLKTQNENLLSVLSNEDKQAKITQCEHAFNAARDLQRSLVASDRPDWLNLYIHFLGLYKKDTNSFQLLKNIFTVYEKLTAHSWSFNRDELKEAYDFDEIFEMFKKDSRLPQLFDSLIEILQKIIDSEEVDSIRVVNTLKKLIATLKKNKNGSYFSTRSAWDFTVSLLKNYLIEELGNIPVLGSLLSALIQTIKDIDSEMVQVHGNMAKEMQTKYKANFAFITYEKHGELKKLPNPESVKCDTHI